MDKSKLASELLEAAKTLVAGKMLKSFVGNTVIIEVDTQMFRIPVKNMGSLLMKETGLIYKELDVLKKAGFKFSPEVNIELASNRNMSLTVSGSISIETFDGFGKKLKELGYHAL